MSQRVRIGTTSLATLYVCDAVSSFFNPFLQTIVLSARYIYVYIYLCARTRHLDLPQDAGEARPSLCIARVCFVCMHTACAQQHSHKGPSRAGALCTHRIISSKNFPTAVHGEDKYRASSSLFRLFLPRRDFPTAEELCLALLDVMLKI